MHFSMHKILPALLSNFNSISMIWNHALDTWSEGRISPFLHPTLTLLAESQHPQMVSAQMPMIAQVTCNAAAKRAFPHRVHLPSTANVCWYSTCSKSSKAASLTIDDHVEILDES